MVNIPHFEDWSGLNDGHVGLVLLAALVVAAGVLAALAAIKRHRAAKQAGNPGAGN